MSRTPQVKVINAAPMGVSVSEKDGTVSVTFVEKSGDHLHVQITRAQLETLSRHIEHARDLLPYPSARQ